MLFQKRFWSGIEDGSITVTFRRWKRRQAVAGNRYRTPAGIIQVESIDLVANTDITDLDAIASGHESAAALIDDLPGEDGTPIYRIEFHLVDEPDPRTVLANQAELGPSDVADIDSRLDRLDNASRTGPWTRQVLEMIEARPRERAPNLAEAFGVDTKPFKVNVRKLKNLGLTLSFNPGYELSPRGVAYLEATRRG